MTVSAFLTTSKNGLDFFGAHQFGVRLNFDVDVKNSDIFDVDGTNEKMASPTRQP